MIRLPPQLFISRKGEPKDDKMLAAAPGYHKPSGGLWTSTLRPDGSSGWTEWCAAEQFGTDEPSEAYVLTPQPCLVFEIGGFADVERLFRQYGVADPSYMRGSSEPIWRYGTINWSAFSDDYDAMHVNEGGLWGLAPAEMPLRLACMFLNGWDCESTCWLRWKFVKVEKLSIERTA